MPERGLIPERGKRAITLQLANMVTHAAVGRGNWVDTANPPPENYNATGLVSEIGRVTLDAIRYLIPDIAGTLHFDGDPSAYRYATNLEIAAAAADAHGPLAPSPDVEFEFTIPANVMNGETICEFALFTDSVTPGPGYTVAGSVINPGQPVYLLNVPGDPMYADKIFNRRIRVDSSN